MKHKTARAVVKKADKIQDSLVANYPKSAQLDIEIKKITARLSHLDVTRAALDDRIKAYRREIGLAEESLVKTDRLTEELNAKLSDRELKRSKIKETVSELRSRYSDILPSLVEAEQVLGDNSSTSNVETPELNYGDLADSLATAVKEKLNDS